MGSKWQMKRIKKTCGLNWWHFNTSTSWVSLRYLGTSKLRFKEKVWLYIKVIYLDSSLIIKNRSKINGLSNLFNSSNYTCRTNISVCEYSPFQSISVKNLSKSWRVAALSVSPRMITSHSSSIHSSHTSLVVNKTFPHLNRNTGKFELIIDTSEIKMIKKMTDGVPLFYLCIFCIIFLQKWNGKWSVDSFELYRCDCFTCMVSYY